MKKAIELKFEENEEKLAIFVSYRNILFFFEFSL